MHIIMVYGCQPKRGGTDGLYVLRSLLQTCCHHNKETWVLFVDIVKSIDSVSHELLFALLAHYGIIQYDVGHTSEYHQSALHQS